jgi:hypothetical protein
VPSENSSYKMACNTWLEGRGFEFEERTSRGEAGATCSLILPLKFQAPRAVTKHLTSEGVQCWVFGLHMNVPADF